MSDSIACIQKVNHFDKFQHMSITIVGDENDQYVGDEIDDGEDVDYEIGEVLV